MHQRIASAQMSTPQTSPFSAKSGSSGSKNDAGVEKGGHADSHWSYVQQPPGERPACPRAYFTMRSGFEAIGT